MRVVWIWIVREITLNLDRDPDSVNPVSVSMWKAPMLKNYIKVETLAHTFYLLYQL